MSKFSIINTIDLDTLDREIDKYVMQTGETSPSVFMHIDTVNAINKVFPVSRECLQIVRCSQDAIGYWEGYEIFIDNSLEFGEVEIRQSKCKHEWHMVGSVGGTKARYKVCVCSKCGEQQTERMVFNKKDGTYKVFILDDENT